MVDPLRRYAQAPLGIERWCHMASDSGFDELAGMAEQGRLSLRVADILPLEGADRAYDAVARGGLRGRIVLTTT